MKASFVLEAGFALAIFAAPATLHAQHAIGVRIGQGDGSAHYSSIGEINARVHAAGRFYLTGAFQMMGANWACVEGSIDAMRCDYDGSSLTLGAAVAAIDSKRAYVALNGGLGGFFRGRGSPYEDDRHLTGNLGIDAEVGVWGPLRLQVGVAHRRVFDGDYRDLIGEAPHVTSIMGGVSFVFGSRE